MKVLTILGARPQFIKSAPLSLALANQGIDEVLLHTGQHYDPGMSDIFFEELKLKKPKYNLGVNGGGHGMQTGKMLLQIEEVFLNEKPDRVLVYGDTNSTLAGALAAAKLHIPVDHIEAGLRSFNKKMPEEINRIIADHVSSLLFTPTETATKNLLEEGFSKNVIKQVGDVMYDTVLHYKPGADKKFQDLQDLYKINKGSYALCTIHRAENTDDLSRMKEIFSSLNKVGKALPILFPIHPRTRKYLNDINTEIKNIHFIEPVGYTEMLSLTANAKIILTDSGGLQKEAYFLETPCVVLRDQTEWVELLNHSNHALIEFGKENSLVEKIHEVLSRGFSYSSSLYGNGKASSKIVDVLISI